MDLIVFVVFYLIGAVALFWVIRLAVRYGMDDALRWNREWLEGRD